MSSKWTQTTIGEITEPISKWNQVDGSDEFLYFDISSIDNNTNKVTTPKHIKKEKAPSRAKQIVKSGDVLFSTVRTYLKNIAIVPDDYQEGIASTGFSVLRGKPGIDTKYLFFFTLSQGFLNRISKHQRGSSYPAVRDDDVRNEDISIPDEATQHRIVEKIEELFSVIDNLKLNLDESQRRISLLKQSIYNQTLVANVPMIPLKQLSTEIKYGYTSKSSSDVKGVPILRITDIQDDSVDWSSVPNCIITDEDKSKYLLKEGDIVFARSGNTVGKTYKVGSNDPNSVYASYLIRIRLGSGLMSEYLYSYFQSADYWGKIKKGSSGVGQPNFNGTKLGNMLIPVPDIRTQGRISNQVKYQISLIKNQESSIRKEVTKLNMFKQAILKQAFEGKLV